MKLSNLEVATRYIIEYGFALIPLHYVTDSGKCSCSNPLCSSIGKHPMGHLVPHGIKNASQEIETVIEWWSKEPQANIGIATGEISDIEVLDIDPRNKGDESLREINKHFGQINCDYIVSTGGGGIHFYFQYSGRKLKIRGDLPGIDFQSDGKFVVAPPSNHKSGQRYQFKTGGFINND